MKTTLNELVQVILGQIIFSNSTKCFSCFNRFFPIGHFRRRVHFFLSQSRITLCQFYEAILVKIKFLSFFSSHRSLHHMHLWSSPLLNKELRQILCGYKKRRRSLHLPKWGSRLPLTDKRKRPTPQKGCCFWPIRPKSSLEGWYSKPRYATKRHTCVSVRLVLSQWKLSRFHLENKS